MKLKILNTKNTQNGDITFPINEPLRTDLIKRAIQSLRSRARQPYGADPRAGLKHSTNIRKRRRVYRGSYGSGIARSPRKILSRNGRRLNWVGAEAPNTVGGRRAHPAKASKIWERKINKKENRKAISSAITATLDKEVVALRGHKLPSTYPFALDADFDALTKTKDVIAALETLGFADDLTRGAQGAKSLLIVTESETLTKAAKNISGVDVASARQLNAYMLAPGAHPGRATLYTTQSIKILSGEEPADSTQKSADSKPKAVKKAANTKPKAAVSKPKAVKKEAKK